MRTFIAPASILTTLLVMGCCTTPPTTTATATATATRREWNQPALPRPLEPSGPQMRKVTSIGRAEDLAYRHALYHDYRRGFWNHITNCLPHPSPTAMDWEHRFDRAMARLAAGDSSGAQEEFESAIRCAETLGYDASRVDPEAIVRHMWNDVRSFADDDYGSPYVAAHHELVLANVLVALLRLIHDREGAEGFALRANEMTRAFESFLSSTPQAKGPPPRPTGLPDFLLAVFAEHRRDFSEGRALESYRSAARREGTEVAGIVPHLLRLESEEVEPLGSPVWLFVLDAPSVWKSEDRMIPSRSTRQALHLVRRMEATRSGRNEGTLGLVEECMRQSFAVPGLVSLEAVADVSVSVQTNTGEEEQVDVVPPIADLRRAAVQSFFLTREAACTRAALRHFSKRLVVIAGVGAFRHNVDGSMGHLFGTVARGFLAHDEVRVHADVRGFTLMPGSVRAIRLNLPPGVHRLTVRTRGKGEETARIRVPHGGRPTYALCVVPDENLCGKIVVSDPADPDPEPSAPATLTSNR